MVLLDFEAWKTSRAMTSPWRVAKEVINQRRIFHLEK